MHRIVVVGTSGSGKSTLAHELSRRLGLHCIEMDAIHWGPNWTSRPREVISGRLDELTSQPRWVVDGNYLKFRDLTWERADTILWLDYPMTIVFSRVVRRTFARWWKGEELWNGNRETLYTQFLTRDSLFLWVINTWRKNRRDYPKMLKDAHTKGKRTIRLRTPRATAGWLEQIQAETERAR